MNALSLAHFNTQNQQEETSWSDDPFGFKGLVTGVTKISDHQRNLDNFIQELVGSYGVYCQDHYELSLDKLSSPYQLELAALYIESIDREIEWACYGEDQTLNSEFLCALLSMLKDSTPKTRTNFAQVTTRNILVYYKESLQNLLDIGCDVYFNNEMHEAGYHAEQDMEHGDVLWRR